jgi:hypothetical protein
MLDGMQRMPRRAVRSIGPVSLGLVLEASRDPRQTEHASVVWRPCVSRRPAPEGALG